MDASAQRQPGRDEGIMRPARPHEARQTQQPKNQDKGREVLQKAQGRASGLKAWWTKVNNDWVFNLSGLLAYNFLISTVPILIVLLAVAGFILGSLNPAQLTALEKQIGQSIPGGSNILFAVFNQLRRSSGVLLVVGIVTAAFAGSRLFITIESCFSIIFRLRRRNAIRQNLMAFGMLAIYVILIPLISLGSVIPSVIVSALGLSSKNPAVSFFLQVAGVAISVVVAAILFGLIYIVVPNRPVRIREVWKGTLVAAVLLLIYNILFPIYERRVLHPGNYGSVAGFAIVILVFFYYLGFILLIGAEINSWASGQRQTYGDITAILHEVQAHDTTRGVAGPTAGLPQEDLQHGKGAEAMRDDRAAVEHERVDHARDAKPARPGEVHEPGPPHKPM
jgi:YihY family inner membrane protein